MTRTRGERNKWRRRYWLPIVKMDYVQLVSGRRYDPQPTGWRRIPDAK